MIDRLIDKDTYQVSVDYSIVEVDPDAAVIVEEKLEMLNVVAVAAAVVVVDDYNYRYFHVVDVNC